MPKRFSTYSFFAALCLCGVAFAQTPRKVVLIAGVKSHGPSVHEYLKSVKLLKVLLDSSPNLAGIKTEVHFNGWPEDPRMLETASTIVIISDGQPSDRLPPMPLMTGERMKVLARLMKRGCGLLSLHYSTFITYAYAQEALDWQGGYYEWKPREGVTSAIKTIEADLAFASPGHPALRGLAPFRLKDEYYYRMRLNNAHAGFAPILRVPDLPGTPDEQTVAWAIQRGDGGRGFATSTGHFFANWRNDSYRKLILNAIVWTAGVDPPEGGVASSYVEEDEVNRRLAGRLVDALVVSSAEVAPALTAALASEIPRFRITRVTPAELKGHKVSRYRLVVLHDVPEIDAAMQKYVRAGGGLIQLGSTGSTLDGVQLAGIPNFEVVNGECGAAFAGSAGKGRIVRTALSCDAERILSPSVTQLILYGSVWAARVQK